MRIRTIAVVVAGTLGAALLTFPANLARADATESFAYTGSVQNFTVPANTTGITITAVGGGGGAYNDGDSSGPNGGGGAQVVAAYTPTAGTVLTIKVGAGGGGGGGSSQGGAATAVTGTGITVVAGGGGGSGPGAQGGSGAAGNTAAGGNGISSSYSGFGGNSSGNGAGGNGNPYPGGCGGAADPVGAAGGVGSANGANATNPPNGAGGGGYGGGNGGESGTGQQGGIAASFTNASGDGRGGDGAGFGGGGGGYAGGGGGGYGGGGGAANCGSSGAGGAGGSHSNDPDATFMAVANGAESSMSTAGGNGSVTIVVTAGPAPTPTPTPAPTNDPEPTPTPTATATVIATPSTTPTPTATDLRPGEATLVVNGVSSPGRVEPTADGSGLVVTGGGIQITIDAVGPTGIRLPLAPDGSLVLSQSGGLIMTGAGFDPSSIVTLFLFSTPVDLGSLQAGPGGAISGSARIPINTESGDHTIQAVGTGPDGKPVTVSLGVRVLPPAAARGANPTVAVMKSGPRSPGAAFDVAASGVQGRCSVTFWTRGSSVASKAGVAGRASATLHAPKATGSWAVTATVSGAGCEPIAAKTFVRVRN